MVARLGSFDELPYLEGVQKPRGPVLCGDARANVRTAIAANDSERKWTVLMTDQPLW